MAVLVENQAVRDHIFVGYRVEDQARDGVKGKKPAPGLVDALGDKISGEGGSAINSVLVLKGIVHLGIGHCARVKPNINEVALAMHGLSLGAGQHPIVHKRTVQVDSRIVGLRHVARNKICQGVRLHVACCHAAFEFGAELFQRANADLVLAVFASPNRERNSPVSAAAEVPVVEVLEPVAKTTGSRAGRLPVNGCVELLKAPLDGSAPNEPTV